MAVEKGSLTFVLDQNLGPRIAELLRISKMLPEGEITNLTDLGFAPNAPDEDWMPALGSRGRYVVVTRDGAILQAAVRLEAWKTSGLILLILDGAWGKLPISSLTRALIYWWPLMVDQANAAQLGTAWTVPHAVPAPHKSIRLITPKLGSSA